MGGGSFPGEGAKCRTVLHVSLSLSVADPALGLGSCPTAHLGPFLTPPSPKECAF